MSADASNWSRVTDLFHRALDVSPADRDALLDRECGDDTSLRAEVASLLAAHDRAGGFIEEPISRAEAWTPSAPPAHTSLSGRTIGHYVVLRQIGEGGMGVVYLAEDTRLGRTVALKALAPQLTADPVRRERLRREARAMAALVHPGVAVVYALEEFQDELYLATEFVPGRTLREELAEGAWSVSQALATAVDIALALAAAHGAGIVHRDLKPENVIRTPTGSIKVLDFGLSRVMTDGSADAPITATGAALGTPAYMSPEQIRGGPIDGRSDLFSLAVMLYEFLAGTNPFRGSDAAASLARVLELEPAPLELDITIDRLADRAAGAPGVDNGASTPGLGPLLATSLAKDPRDRFASASAMAEAMRGVQASVSPSTRVRSAARPGSGTAAVRSASAGDATTATASRVQRTAGATHALWWWQFHQAAACVTYLALLVPLWFLRGGLARPRGVQLLLLGLAAVVVADALRLHLWFASRSYPAEWPAQHRKSRWWVRAADVVFVGVLGTFGLLVAETNTLASGLLVAAAAGVLVSAAIIEPATTRAAFETP